MFSDRLEKGQVRKLLSEVLKSGHIRMTDYCERRMLERGISSVMLINVLERGRVKDGEEYTFHGLSQWRYRVETQRYRAIIAFEIENEVLVINAIDFLQGH